jgi:inner membrane protein import complex subunit Tim44-like protein
MKIFSDTPRPMLRAAFFLAVWAGVYSAASRRRAVWVAVRPWAFWRLGGGLSILGLLLQIGLLFLMFKIVMGFMRGGQPAVQDAAHGSGFGRGLGQGLGQGSVRTPGGFAGFGGGAGSAQSATKLEVTPADFSVFEQRLAAIQTAFGEEDFDRLRVLATPEMASYFAEELAANAKNGLVNRVSDVKFLRGDLSEAWREQQGEYATVAMRFSLVDIMSDRVSGRIVGSAAGNRGLDLCAAPGGRPQATGNYRRYNKPDERGIASGVLAASHPDAGMFWRRRPVAGRHLPCKVRGWSNVCLMGRSSPSRLIPAVADHSTLDLAASFHTGSYATAYDFS